MDWAWFTWTVAEQDSGSDRYAFLHSLDYLDLRGLDFLGFYDNAITGFNRPGLPNPGSLSNETVFLDLQGVVYLNLQRLDYLELVKWITWKR
jgi:hypothetical protein